MDCATMGWPKEQCVALKIKQLVLHKFTVNENVDQQEIILDWWFCAFTYIYVFTRLKFFSIFPYGIKIKVHFHLGHFLAKGNQQLLVP